MSTVKRSVVVGVDSSREAMVAARYAVSQAQARGLDLLLVYAYPLPPIDAGMPGDMFTCMREAAEAVVAEVVTELAAPPSVIVRTLVGQTAPILLLEQAADSAELMIVGQDHAGFFEKLLVGGVASPLCRDASCPVVVVPVKWQPAPVNRDPLVVALGGTAAASQALRLAFEEAARAKVSIVAVHAMPVGTSADALGAEERKLTEILAGYKTDYPDVGVVVHTTVGDPNRVVIEASMGASMLVVSSPHASRPTSWMRSLAHRVLNHTQCPVVVIPQQRAGRHEHNSSSPATFRTAAG
jgi:nucleotide-binding universal stress UspA family protein